METPAAAAEATVTTAKRQLNKRALNYYKQRKIHLQTKRSN